MLDVVSHLTAGRSFSGNGLAARLLCPSFMTFCRASRAHCWLVPSGLSMAGAVRIVQCPLTVPRLMNMLPTCSTRVCGRQQATSWIKSNLLPT